MISLVRLSFVGSSVIAEGATLQPLFLSCEEVQGQGALFFFGHDALTPALSL